jgi:large repetitive protein
VKINFMTDGLSLLSNFPLTVVMLLAPILISCSTNASISNPATSGPLPSAATPARAPAHCPCVGGAFSFAGSMMNSRLAHTATMLPNGDVLIVGGGEGPDLVDGFSVVGGAELLDHATGTFVSAGTESRDLHTATLLQNGKVLLVGGETGWTGIPPSPIVTASADLYDPATGVFQATGDMTTGRESHTATLLGDGRVLVTGGARLQGTTWETLQTAEIYDPASGTFSSTGSMVNARSFHTATLLSNGNVLVTGGNVGGVTAELYDPVTGSFALTGSMSVARSSHTATLLPNGKVLVVGGPTAELYDPVTGSFALTGAMSVARRFHTATLLGHDAVMIAGGAGGTGFSPDTAVTEIYDIATGSFAQTGSMETGRLWHTATSLDATGQFVLVIGGATSSDGIHITPLKTAEIWDYWDY